MPSPSLIFGVNDLGFVVLDLNNYDYSNDNIVMNLLREYKKVQFADRFNSRIDWLPEGITEIGLGMNFNQPLENLPSTTKKITIAKYSDIGQSIFNQPLEYLPEGLEEFYIKFGIAFNQPLHNLPSSLKKLYIFSQAFTNNINHLPDGLEYLYIRSFDYNNTFTLPANLKTIEICEYKCSVESLNNLEYNGLRQLQNKYPEVQFIYKD